MEEHLDLEIFLKKIAPIEIRYYAKFDISTGEIFGIYPSNTNFKNNDTWVEVDLETADRICAGQECITNFAIDVTTDSMPIVDIRKLKVPDHVHTLYRIPEIQFIKKSPELVIQYRADSNVFQLTLGEKYSKIKLLAFKNLPCHLYITEYNDPNMLYETLTFSIDNILNEGIDVIKLTTKFNKHTCSLFTPQVFNVFAFEVI